jgi:methylglutaconyl-CoA hydratase
MINEVANGYVKTEKERGIATIEFYHPQSNSLPAQLLQTLAEAIDNEGLNSATSVIILRSAGQKIFCSGASFNELEKITSAEDGSNFFNGFANVINAMRKAPKFIIARVHGKAVGGGVGLAAAADYAIAVEGADIKLSELSAGFGPFVIAPAVQRKIGLSSFTQLAINANTWHSAEWAKTKGLYAEVHPEASEMENAIQKLSHTLSNSNSEAMKELKKILWQGTGDWDELLNERASISGRLILSDHSRNFIRNFKLKS